MRKLLVAITGDWDGGNNGEYPLILEYDSSESDVPFISSQGWGHGYSGNNFSLDTLKKYNIIELYSKPESFWAYEILIETLKENLDSHEAGKSLLSNLHGNEPNLPPDLLAILQRNA
ncbi:hypothetical protein L4C54_02155 [Vibrio lamellibrachiae]